MENKDDSDFFEDICNIARVLPNLTGSNIYSELNMFKNEPNRVKLILRKYFASYESEEHNCMSDDIKKIKRVLPDYPFIHINNDLLAVEDKENRVQLVLKKYFDNEVRATKRSLLLDSVDQTDSSSNKKSKLDENTSDSHSDLNTEQFSNSVEREQSSTETESYTAELQPTTDQSDQELESNYMQDKNCDTAPNQELESNNKQGENCNSEPETNSNSELFKDFVPMDANDQNRNVSEEINNDNQCKNTLEIVTDPEKQKENETEKTTFLSILSDLFPQHSADVFKIICNDFGINLHDPPNESTVDIVVNSLINYCSTEDTDEVKITQVYSVSNCDQQNSVTGSVETSQAESTEDFGVGDMEYLFRTTVENIILHRSDKDNSNTAEPTSSVNKELVETDNLAPQNAVKDLPDLYYDPNSVVPDQNAVLNELQNFLNATPELTTHISKLCPNPETSQFENNFVPSISTSVPSTNIPELSTVEKPKSANDATAKNSNALHFENSALVDFNTEISQLYQNSETSQLTKSKPFTAELNNSPIPSTSTNISELSTVQLPAYGRSPNDILNTIIQTYGSKKRNLESIRNSDILNFESALLNNVFPDLNPPLNMASGSGTSRVKKAPVLTSQSNSIIKPALFHPKPSTSRSTTAGNFPRTSTPIIKPATFQPKSTKTTSSERNKQAAGIYTTAKPKAITSVVCSTGTNINRSSSSKSGLNSKSLTTTINTNLCKNSLSKSNPNVSSTKSPTNSTRINQNSVNISCRCTRRPNSNSRTILKTSTITTENNNILKLNNVKTRLVVPEIKANNLVTDLAVSKILTSRSLAPKTKNTIELTKTTSKTVNKTCLTKDVPSPIPSTSSKSNTSIKKKITKSSTEVEVVTHPRSNTHSIPDSSSKGLISAKQVNTITIANATASSSISTNETVTSKNKNFVQGIKKEFPKVSINQLPSTSTSGARSSFASKKQDINKNTLRVRTDLYDDYFNGPLYKQLSVQTTVTGITQTNEENDDIIFVSVDHLPQKTSNPINLAPTIDISPQNTANLLTNSIATNEPAPSATKIQKIEDNLVVTISDIDQPSTSNVNTNHPFYFKLLEIFPDICPRYLKKLCSMNNENQTLDDIISTLLNGDYDRRDRAASPESNLDFEEQHKILQDLFPDADPAYLQHHCERLIDQPDNFKQFVASMIENKNYPTKEEYLKKMKLSAQEKQYTTEFDVKKFLEVIPNPEEFFKDPKRQVSFSNFDDTNYAVTFLKNTFSTTAIKDITSVFKKNNYSILRSAVVLEKIQNLKTKRKIYAVTSCKNIPLLQEIAYVKHKKEIQEYIKKQKLEKKLEREHAKSAGLMKTCQCCYDDEVMPDDTETCESGQHTFCKDCIRKGCEVLIGDGKLNFPCLETCESFFTLQVLQAVLSPKVFSKMAQRKQMAEVKSAGIEDLEFCPFCDFATIPAPGDKLFRCLNSDCMKESCRLCKEPSHIPLRCDEVEKDKDVKMRTYIEDKMTEALLRKCWKCGMKFIKESGCNKMTCSCGALMCYVCNQPVQDYKHFNGQGGDQTHLCPLYSDTHKLHVDAIKRGAESAKKELGVNNENQLKIDPTVDLEQHYRRLAALNPAVPNIPVMMPNNNNNILPR